MLNFATTIIFLTYTAMRQRIFLLLLAMIALGATAQKRYCNMQRMQANLKEGLTADFEHRNDKRQVLKTVQFLKNDTSQLWTDGRIVFYSIYNPYFKDKEYNPDNRGEIEIGLCPEFQIDQEVTFLNNDFDIVKNTVIERKSKFTVTVEKLGRYTMLVYRNAQGAPVKAYYHIDNESANDASWTYIFHYILDGNYMLNNGNNAVFGIKQEFYEGASYNCDPGIYCYNINSHDQAVEIIYGDGRVSHGNPNDPKYDKMPGGGGAGAIMGPMTWQVKLTNEGLDAKVVHDEPFVDHNPRLAKGNNVLTKVQCPWQGVDGKWAFASVIPLTHELLKLFPKETIELMRAEIYARHGDTFKSAANQKYFDQQPWYKKSGKTVVLTDIEKFNVALIKQVMATLN